MNNNKVLIVTHHYLNGNGGGVFASRAYINAFAEIYSDVTLLYPAKEGHPIEHISPQINATPIKYDVSKFVKLWHVLTGKSHRYFGVFEKELIRGKYDIVVFDTSNVTWKLIDIAHRHLAKVITIHHNFQMEYDRDNCTPLLRPIILYWTKKREKYSVKNSDLNLTITYQDRELLYSNYDPHRENDIKVLGCFEYERNQTTESIVSAPGSNRFVITGNLSAIQTEQSLFAWFNDYYPLLKKEYPNHTLTIAGKNPSKKLITKCQELGIQIIPSPVNMDSILDNSDYYICPTFLGGGLKLRIMDGLRKGLPILTHEVSARGYDSFKKRRMLFSYNNQKSFCAALKELKATSISRKEIIENFRHEFAYEAGIERIKEITNSLTMSPANNFNSNI